MIKTDRFEQVEVASSAQLHDWLAKHHHQADSIWLVTFKKHVAGKYVSVDDILDEVLCFGWIDGLRRKLDDDRTMQLLSPRRHQVWAKSYKDRAARLLAGGHMQPPGLVAIEASKRAGKWDAMADVDALVIPPDLADGLRASISALENFERSAPSYRRNVLRWIASAKTPETRLKRIAQTVDFASRGVNIP
jgi:uncharacterized protein YdeI (YjbR/CyaY-like superfamily)